MPERDREGQGVEPAGAANDRAAGAPDDRAPGDRAPDDRAPDDRAPDDRAPAAGSAIASDERRRFLSHLSLALAAAAGVFVSVPVVGFLLSPQRQRPPEMWRRIGGVGEFALGATVKVSYLDPGALPWAGFAAESAAWVRREGERDFVAFSIYCTHTACPVRWFEGAELFLCPCHGGVFRRDGSVASGPPPRPLDRHEVRVRGGQVEIRTIGIPTPP